ncbi:GntR family transcriptional regulator, partial [Bacillus thuringiensis]
LLIFGPIKGILYVLQEKDFHYPIISKWINK